MNVTRALEAPPYVADAHHGVSTVRLQGHEASRTDRFWVGVSMYSPGGRAEEAPTREETVYVVLEGELAVTTNGSETLLKRLDSIHLAKGQVRAINNRSKSQALLLVTVAHPTVEQP